MSRSVNKVILIGHLGQDPELRYTGSGTAVCNIRLATNEGYKDQSGEWVDKTEWHSIVAWAKLAEICNDYLRKGSQVYFEGSLQTRKWQDKDANDRYSTEVKANEMLMLGGKEDGGGRPASKGRGRKPEPQPSAQRSQGSDQEQGDFGFDPDDDYPF